MKTLYVCQAEWGLLAFTYAENDEEATEYFEKLFAQYTPTWLGGTTCTWRSPEGWSLPATEDQYIAAPPKHPYVLKEIQSKLEAYEERREKKRAKARVHHKAQEHP